MSNLQNQFMREAIRLSVENVKTGKGGPFAAVVVKDGKIIAQGTNLVTSTNDPTAHAEVVAIREACRVLNSFQLEGCELYASCEPCPMCLGAIYWSRPSKVYFGSTREDAASIGFDDAMIYDEISLPASARKISMTQCLRDEAMAAFHEWERSSNKVSY